MHENALILANVNLYNYSATTVLININNIAIIKFWWSLVLSIKLILEGTNFQK